MSKNKVVIFSKEGIARIIISDTPESIACLPDEQLFINPELGLVATVPPEFWTVEEGKIIPLTDPVKIKERVKKLHVKASIDNASAKVKEGLESLIGLPELINKRLADVVPFLQKDILAVSHKINELSQDQKDSFYMSASERKGCHSLLEDNLAKLLEQLNFCWRVSLSLWAILFVLLIYAIMRG